MKRISFTLFLVHLFLFSGLLAQSATDFVTTWKTDNTGSSNSTSITIPTFPGETYNYDVDWDNDGTFDEFSLTGDVTHDFGAAGTYTIRIQGTFPRIYFNNTGDRHKILSVEQWGNNPWTSMEKAFMGCWYLEIDATDAPDLSGVTSMEIMFQRCDIMNQDIGHWDVASVTNMRGLFYRCFDFNQDLSSWNVSNVTDMGGMFREAGSFNQDISSWNVSSVQMMDGMFYSAGSFNQPLGNWDVSNVTNMANMFDNPLTGDFDQAFENPSFSLGRPLPFLCLPSRSPCQAQQD